MSFFHYKFMKNPVLLLLCIVTYEGFACREIQACKGIQGQACSKGIHSNIWDWLSGNICAQSQQIMNGWCNTLM